MTITDKRFDPCCDAWTKAHEAGSDSEGFAALIWYSDDEKDERPYTSCLQTGQEDGESQLPPIAFCPWCGDEKAAYVGEGVLPRAETMAYLRGETMLDATDWEHAEDLCARLEALSKALECSGRIDEHETPGAYATVLDAMIFVGNVAHEPEPLTNEQMRQMLDAMPTAEKIKRAEDNVRETLALRPAGSYWGEILPTPPPTEEA